MSQWNRRSVLTSLGAAAASTWVPISADALGLADDKIKVVRYFKNSGDSQGRRGQPMVNQSANVVMVETEEGNGVGEGGEPTMEQCASMLIGLDPFRVDHHWQRMMRGYFYTAGREKLHSIGALDIALWDLKAKALDVPVWQMLGRQLRDHVECTPPLYRGPAGGTIGRRGAGVWSGPASELPPLHRQPHRAKWIASRSSVRRTRTVNCRHKGAGDGHWAIDFHTEFDPPVRQLARLIEPLHPYFGEDLIRSENPCDPTDVRELTRVPIAVGEQFGYSWDSTP